MRILIVDDSKGMRGLVKRALTTAGYGDHTFQEAGNGLEALKIVHADAPDLVLTDWNMPHMDGMELLRVLRDGGQTVKVGFITSETTDAMRSDAMAAGANFIISKPFSPESVRAAMQGILS